MEEYSTETNKYEYLKSRLRSTGLYELERTDNILSTLAINITKISQCTPTGVVVYCVPKLPFSDDGFTIIKTDTLYSNIKINIKYRVGTIENNVESIH